MEQTSGWASMRNSRPVTDQDGPPNSDLVLRAGTVLVRRKPVLISIQFVYIENILDCVSRTIHCSLVFFCLFIFKTL
jgi:hypothetical protein